MVLRRRKLLRLHLLDRNESIEGILVGFEAGHYRLAKSSVIAAEGQTRALTGETWVPRERVLYAQRLG